MVILSAVHSSFLRGIATWINHKHCKTFSDIIMSSTTTAKLSSSSSTSSPSSSSVDDITKIILTIAGWIGVMYMTYHILWSAYKIRLQAIEEYGPVIHEFDPYFNYRATEVREDSLFLWIISYYRWRTKFVGLELSRIVNETSITVFFFLSRFFLVW